MSEETKFEETFEEAVKQTKISIYTPIIYLTVLITALIIFSIRYRKNKINQLTKQAPFFGENYPKEIYLQLKANEPKPNEKVLKAALLRRGAESIRRSIKLKEVTPFMKQLYERGSIGDELWERFETAQKLENLEIQELVAEAETYKKGWVQKFVPLLQEICFNEALRRRFMAIDDRKFEILEHWGIEIDDEGILKVPNQPKGSNAPVLKTSIKTAQLK